MTDLEVVVWIHHVKERATLFYIGMWSNERFQYLIIDPAQDDNQGYDHYSTYM